MRTRTVRADELEKGHRLADIGRTVESVAGRHDKNGAPFVIVFLAAAPGGGAGLPLPTWDTLVTIIDEDH